MKAIDIIGELPKHPTKKYDLRSRADIKRIVFHCTDWDIDPWELAKYDIGPNHISSTGCPAITYAEMAMPDGTIYKCLPWETISWHVGVWNKSSLGFAISYQAKNQPAPKALTASIKRMGTICMNLGLPPDKIIGHRELEFTGFKWINLRKSYLKSCPGWNIDMDNVRFRAAKYIQLCLKSAKFYTGAIDGIFGPLSLAALDKFSKVKI